MHSVDKCSTLPDPWGQALTTNSHVCPHLCPRWGRWGILLIGALLSCLPFGMWSRQQKFGVLNDAYAKWSHATDIANMGHLQCDEPCANMAC